MIDSHPQRCPIPDGTLINAELTITSYFDSDGRLKYGVHLEGGPNIAQALGLLELAKISIYEMFMSQTDDDEEGDESGNG